MKGKIVTIFVGITLLLPFLPGVLSGIEQTGGNTIYVDDDNTMGPWDGSQEHPFQHIQNGVDNASGGDTVFVFDGLYIENIAIEKPLILQGANKHTVIVDGDKNDDVVLITAGNVTLSDFTIQNSGKNEFDFGIEIRSNNNTLLNNVIKDNGGLHGWTRGGIYLINASYNNIGDNLIFSNDREGIHLLGSNYNNIHNNQIYGNDYFAIIFDASNHNIIQNNDMFENYVCMSFWPFSTYNEIIGNIIHDHNYYSLSFYSLSDNNIVHYNNFSNNIEWSLRIAGANNNLIEYNIISGSSGGSWGYGYGILLEYAFQNTIGYNNIMNNRDNAMMINSFKNQWNGNYWGDYVGFGPKIIPGKISIPQIPSLSIPWLNFDWHPAKEPYDIPTGGA